MPRPIAVAIIVVSLKEAEAIKFMSKRFFNILCIGAGIVAGMYIGYDRAINSLPSGEQANWPVGVAWAFVSAIGIAYGLMRLLNPPPPFIRKTPTGEEALLRKHKSYLNCKRTLFGLVIYSALLAILRQCPLSQGDIFFLTICGLFWLIPFVGILMYSIQEYRRLNKIVNECEGH